MWRRQEEIRTLRSAKESREGEVARLQAKAAAKEAAPQLSVAHVNEEKNLTIAQLNHQVDFLNNRMVEQDAELAHARQAEEAANAQVRHSASASSRPRLLWPCLLLV